MSHGREDNRRALFTIYIIGTLRSDDGDGNENATKAIGLITKTTILHVHHAFLYISLPSLHDYDVKMPKFTMYRGSTEATTKFPLSFWSWIWFLGIQLQEGSPTFDKVSDLELSRWRLKEREFTFSTTFSLQSPSSDLKVPINIWTVSSDVSIQRRHW